jgi:hypothetical protein
VVVACGSVQVKFLLGGMEGLRSFMVAPCTAGTEEFGT